MKKLSKREIILLYALACFVIVMGGFYLVLFPSYNQYQNLRNQLSEAEYQQNTMSAAIENVPVVMTARDDASFVLSALKSPFSAHLPNEGLDALLTKLCLDYSLKAKVLNVTSNAWTGVATFTEAPLVYQTTPGQAEGAAAPTTTATGAETTTESSTETASVSSGSAETWTGTVSMELTGTQFNFQRLVDGVAARSDMIISSYELLPVGQSTDGTSTSGTTTTTTTSSGWAPELDGGDATINVMFTVYMVDK
ncbi:hypothetical protein [Acetobacterium bakii]|uniref:Uncharacterized protein n=1 Tax=Acetobacterium bakii TaxID=52689 RepID=A0A0L6U3L9_9FIRM|nr:hypothetical protein [Acetobacterium bakii]KNZ43118.1 hypothetical protein AKG39_02920 [Acetobacterium bakii]